MTKFHKTNQVLNLEIPVSSEWFDYGFDVWKVFLDISKFLIKYVMKVIYNCFEIKIIGISGSAFQLIRFFFFQKQKTEKYWTDKSGYRLMLMQEYPRFNTGIER